MKVWLAIAAACCLFPVGAQAASRFAVVIANDEGHAGHQRLWYASQDAERFAQALTELGDFPRDQVVVLHESRLTEAREQLAAVEARIAAAQRQGERTLLLFYFSGHANETGLELGPDQLLYSELRSALMQSVANTRIAVVDACGAGALTQVKGGRASSAVEFAVPAGDEPDGFAFLASTAVGESAQESSAIEGSFFTRHLEAALRGAGDLDGDGRVTLTEAFLYTSRQTVSATSLTSVGAQHPTYESHLSGRGDVVLAYLGKAESTLMLPPAEGSAYLIRGAHQFLAEVPGGSRTTQLALPSGIYDIDRKTDDYVQSTRVSLSQGQKAALPPLSEKRVVLASSKGGPGATEVSVGVSISSGFMLHSGGAWGGRVAITRAIGPIRIRLMATAGGQSVDDAGLDYQLVSAGGALALLVPVMHGPARVELGVQGGAEWFQEGLESGRSLDAVGGRWDGLALLSYPIGAMRIGTELAAGLETLPLNGGVSNRFIAGATLFAGWAF